MLINRLKIVLKWFLILSFMLPLALVVIGLVLAFLLDFSPLGGLTFLLLIVTILIIYLKNKIKYFFRKKISIKDQIENRDDKDFDELLAEKSIKNLSLHLSDLDRDEKFILLLGLLALFGDGDFSHEEIDHLRNVLVEMKLEPLSVIHRDPSDAALCLEEKLAWALTLIRQNFANNNFLSKEEIIVIFDALSVSIENDIVHSLPDEVSQRGYSDNLRNALLEMASADGQKSKFEKVLITRFERLSKLQT